MVIKLAPTVLEEGAAVCPHSMLMPGCVLGRGAMLLDNSQVLKGEAVPPGERWAGLPAMRCPAAPLPPEVTRQLTAVSEQGAAGAAGGGWGAFGRAKGGEEDVEDEEVGEEAGEEADEEVREKLGDQEGGGEEGARHGGEVGERQEGGQSSAALLVGVRAFEDGSVVEFVDLGRRFLVARHHPRAPCLALRVGAGPQPRTWTFARGSQAPPPLYAHLIWRSHLQAARRLCAIAAGREAAGAGRALAAAVGAGAGRCPATHGRHAGRQRPVGAVSGVCRGRVGWAGCPAPRGGHRRVSVGEGWRARGHARLR